MDIESAEAELLTVAAADGVDLEAVTATVLIRLVTDWYRESRVDGVDLNGDGDMVLFQWGTHDWRGGNGPNFELNITRQFSVDETEENDAAMWQLGVTQFFPPDDGNAALGSGHHWCHHPDDIDVFIGQATSAAATVWADERTPATTEILFEEV